jgi:hypothetical protein
MSIIQNEIRSTEITKFISDPAQIKTLKDHVEQLVRGDAFRASPRSQQFLKYVVDKAIHGDFDSLKERVIGVELFHRPPSFDTGEDSIVRVTASDVRKRLLQHYGRYGDGSEVRLAIPSGSYIPEITWSRPPDFTAPTSAPGEVHKSEETNESTVASVEQAARPEPSSVETRSPIRTKLWLYAIPVVLLCSAGLFFLGYEAHRAEAPTPKTLMFPWSAILRPGRSLQIVASDPDFAAIQDITAHATTLSDYANGRYVPNSSTSSPELRTFALKYLQGRKVADIDVPIAANIATLASSVSEKVNLRSARTLRLSDFNTDDDFVLLGSPLSNPWSDLFTEQLDFRFVFVDNSSLQNIENIHPQGSELKIYSPSGRGFTSAGPATGTSFAIIALVRNPNQRGQVLLIAGTGAEATEAAGHLATSLSEFRDVLNRCHAAPDKPLQRFEMLLRVGIMAGSPSSSEVIACHVLSDDK